MPLNPGSRIGGYEVIAELGAGGMGHVYKAHDPKLQRTVAIKVLATQDEDTSARLLQEARAASALNHPHICTIHEVGEHEGQAFIVMEHVEGKPLSQLIPGDGLPPESVIRYGTQIADALARQAVQLDETLAEAHTALGYAHFRFDWSWDEAEREFAKALDMNPRFATAQHYYAMLLILLGRDGAALTAVSRAIELDPLSPILLTAKGRILYFSRRFEEAISQLHAVLELEPEFAQAHFDLGMAYSQVGRYDPAVESLERAVSLSGRRPLFVGVLASVLGLAGQRDKIPGLLDELRAKGHATGVTLAGIHVGLGDYERAVDATEEAYTNREGPLLNMLLEPLVDPLRADPRFKHVVRQMGLPEWSWRTSNPDSVS